MDGIKEQIAAIDAKLELLLSKGSDPHTLLYQAAHYLLLAPGKRIRPLLTLAVAEMVGGSREEALTAGSAIEMIHTYSLIHDDLPCMDDDDMRRGKPSMHKAYDEATAVLVGDFLLTYAFEVLADQMQLEEKERVRLISTLARASGGRGMVGGQILDISTTKNDIDYVHSLKTAALFQASFAFGAIIASLSPSLTEEIAALGHDFGLLFQLIDDLIDGDHPEGREKAMAKMEEKRSAFLTKVKVLPYNYEPLLLLLKTISPF